MLNTLGKKIIFYLVFILGLFWTCFFIWINKQHETSRIDQMRQQARGIYHYMALTRQWISSHQGVYFKDNESELSRITPSSFTNEIARFARGKLPYSVKVAVQEAADPSHVPDDFEYEAIDILKKERRVEVWDLEKSKAGMIFRYAAPLLFENECASCHPDLKIDKSRVLGCISISFPADSLYRELSDSRKYYALYLVGSLGLALLLLWGSLRTSVLKPLNQLTNASRRIQQGDINVRVELQASDEWKRVGSSFNQMVQSLADQQKKLEHEVEKAVTELSEAYQQLKRVDRFKSDFFSNITHDLKTPLTAIKGATDLIEKKSGSRDTTVYLDIIRRNNDKLSKMVKDLLDCAKIESGRLEIKKEENDLAEVVEDAILMLMPLAWERKVKINYSVPKEPIVLCFDRDHLEQALSNLLSNAIKFSPGESAVDIHVKQTGGLAVVSVEDYGPGIPREEWDIVFEKFFRRSNEKASEGMGLGLAIAKGIIEANGGKIWISQPEHQGIILNLALPSKPTCIPS